jgi:hypothetical protein
MCLIDFGWEELMVRFTLMLHLVFFSAVNYAAAAGTIRCTSQKLGLDVTFPVTSREDGTLAGDITVTGVVNAENKPMSVSKTQVVGYWYDEGSFLVKARDEEMKDNVLVLRNKQGKGTIYLRLGKAFLKDARINCDYPYKASAAPVASSAQTTGTISPQGAAAASPSGSQPKPTANP